MTRPTVLITGGSGGIGGALAQGLAARGYTPIIGFAGNTAAAQKSAARTGGHAMALDLTEHSHIDDAVATLKTGVLEAGPLAGVVMAASPRPQVLPFTKTSPEDMALQWQVNVAGHQRLLAGLIKQCLRQQKKGTAVAVLTAAMGLGGRPAAPNMAAYIVAKHGLAGVLAAAAADYPWLTTAAVSPSFTETEMLKIFDPRFLEMMRAAEPNGRFATASEVAKDILAHFEDLS